MIVAVVVSMRMAEGIPSHTGTTEIQAYRYYIEQLQGTYTEETRAWLEQETQIMEMTDQEALTHVTDPAKLAETEGVYRMPLDGGNPVPIAEVQGNAIFEIYPYGDFVYGWCGMENATYLFVYDSKTEKTTARRFEQENILFFIPWEDGFLGMDNGRLFQISPDLKHVEQVGTLLSDNKNEFGISDHDEFWLYSFLSTDDDYFYFQGSVTTQEEIKEFVAIYEKESLSLQQILFVDGMPDSQCIGVDENQIFFTGRAENGDAVFWLEKETMLEKGAQFHVLQP